MTTLYRWFDMLRTLHERQRTFESVARLNDHLLQDIGIDRGMIGDYVQQSLPWPSFDAEPAPSLQPSLTGCG